MFNTTRKSIWGLIILVCCLVASTPVFAQAESHTVKGVVLDGTSTPMPGVSVQIKGTLQGASTDLDGAFELEAASSDVLIFSFIGMQNVEMLVADQTYVTITLLPENIGLDEVIVVGYGTQKKATLTGSVSQVGGEDLKKVAAVNVSNTLAGKTAGVIANVRSGAPGEDGATIYIRGKATLGSNSPLIVVDGIADRSFSRLNPEDIESVSVLKDASAAIYGARAANGVILVTTKRGSQGKSEVRYSGNFALTQPTRVPKVLDALQYVTYINEYDAKLKSTPTYSEAVIETIKNGSDPINYANTNWWNEVSKEWAQKTQHSLSFSSGNERARFYASAQYLWQDAIYKNSAYNYKQYQFVSNIDAQMGQAGHFSLDILGRQEARDYGMSSTDYIFTYFMTTSPLTSPYFPNGLPRVGWDGLTNNAAMMVTDAGGWSKNRNNYLTLKPKLRLDLDFITKGLYAEAYVAMDFSFNFGKSVGFPFDLYTYDAANDEYISQRSGTGVIWVSQSSSYSTSYTPNIRLGFSRSFGESKLDAFVAYEQNTYYYSSLSASRTNFLSDAILELFAGSDIPEDISNNGYAGQSASQNLFGRINYNYADKYLAEFTVRHDGSMNFAKGHRWGTFPSLSLGWVMSEESFMEESKGLINFLKLRASYGMMGNDAVSAYQYLTQYSFGEGTNFGEETVVNKGTVQSVTANPDITWETAHSYNVGVTSQFFDGKLSLDLDYFFSKRSGILITRNASIPTYAGLSLPAENLGKVNNQGVEVVLGYRNHVGDFNFGATGTFTYARNKVVYMDEAANTLSWQRREGTPIDGRTMYKAIGIFQTKDDIKNNPAITGTHVGDLQYEDISGDGVISSDDMFRSDLSATPRIIYGLTLDGSWKGLDVNIFFQGQALAEQMILPGMNMITDFYEGRWTTANTDEENLKARWPRALIKQSYTDQWSGLASTWWTRSAAFLRLKSVELGYTFPAEIAHAIGMQNGRIYLNGYNLLSFDNIKICDPEVPSSSFGTGTNFYPQQRMITLGLNLTF